MEGQVKKLGEIILGLRRPTNVLMPLLRDWRFSFVYIDLFGYYLINCCIVILFAVYVAS